MDVNRLGKDLEHTYKILSELTVDYHNLILNPKLNEEMQAGAVLHYAERILNYLDLIGDINKYYRSRPGVEKSIIANLLKISDGVDKLLHQQNFDKLLEEINDNGSKISGDKLSDRDVPTIPFRRRRIGKTTKLD